MPVRLTGFEVPKRVLSWVPARFRVAAVASGVKRPFVGLAYVSGPSQRIEWEFQGRSGAVERGGEVAWLLSPGREGAIAAEPYLTFPEPGEYRVAAVAGFVDENGFPTYTDRSEAAVKVEPGLPASPAVIAGAAALLIGVPLALLLIRR